MTSEIHAAVAMSSDEQKSFTNQRISKVKAKHNSRSISLLHSLKRRGILPWMNIAAECADIVMSIRDNPRMLDYASVAIRLGSKIIGNESKEDIIHTYFEDEPWREYELHDELLSAVVMLLKSLDHTTVLASSGSSRLQVFEDGDVRIGWIEWDNSDRIDGLYTDAESDSGVSKVLRRHFWKQMDSDHVMLSSTAGKRRNMGSIFVNDAFDITDCVLSPEARRMALRLMKFDDAAKPWAVLYNGPPGTGKSTIIKQIAHTLAKKTLRIPVYDVGSMDPEAVVNAVQLFRPEVLIIDDLDRVSNPIMLLDGMEKFRIFTGIVLTTMNYADAVTPALLRPGRIDEIVDVLQPDETLVKQYIPEHDQNFDVAKTWPIAYIRAYCDIRDVLGQDDANEIVPLLDQRQRDANKDEFGAFVGKNLHGQAAVLKRLMNDLNVLDNEDDDDENGDDDVEKGIAKKA